MTPNNNDSMAPPPAKRRITRSATFKLGLAEFSSVGFFSSHGTTCDPSQRAEMSEELYRDAYDDVERAVREYKAMIGQIAQATLHPQPAPAKPEVNPFRVSQAAPAEVPPPDPVEKSVAPEKSNLDTVQTQEVKPEAETRRRGRPPKGDQRSIVGAARGDASPAKPEDVPLHLEHAAPNDPSQFKADDSDIPEALGGTSPIPPGPDLKAKHEEIRAAEAAKVAIPAKPNGPQLVPPSKPVPTQEERIAAVQATLVAQKKRTPENVQECIKEFFRGALNREKLARPPAPEYDPIVPLLENICRRDPDSLLGEPRKVGLEAGVGWRKFSEHTAKWSDRLRAAATDVAVWRYPDNCMFLLEFLHETAKLDKLDSELGIFLLTFRASDAAIAMALRKTSEESGKSMTDMMAGLDWENCSQGDILARISGVAPVGQTAQTESLWPE